jgi:1-pyrroline-5-carboxylate dehydrogenase
MSFGIFKIEMPKNEPVLSYAPGTPERAEIKAKLEELKSSVIEIPVISGGEEHWSNETVDVVMPHNHKHVLAKAHLADGETLKEAISNALKAKQRYLELPWEERASLFLRAADLISGPWRATLNAVTMLGLSKTVHEAEIDSACELINMLRFNTYWMTEIYQQQPISSKGIWNRLEYRPLDGFVLAITPFNFASIAGNLPTAPAIMGNVVLWKPASNALYPAYFIMKVLQEAGIPDGVINFLPAKGAFIDEFVLDHPELGGVHFTGSPGTMKHIWRRIGENIDKYRQYPRIVGETGGKDFVFAHKSADIDALVTALISGAFEYQARNALQPQGRTSPRRRGLR